MFDMLLAICRKLWGWEGEERKDEVSEDTDYSFVVSHMLKRVFFFSCCALNQQQQQKKIKKKGILCFLLKEALHFCKYDVPQVKKNSQNYFKENEQNTVNGLEHEKAKVLK